jgi:hypothetical protein
MTEIESLADKSTSCQWLVYSIVVVEANYPHLSDVGSLLAEKNPDHVILIWNKKNNGMYSYSLRSSPNGNINVGEIAKKLKG